MNNTTPNNSDRIESARAVRECLRQVLKDASEAELPLVSLHIRIAILEANDFIAEAANEASHETAAAEAEAPPARRDASM